MARKILLSFLTIVCIFSAVKAAGTQKLLITEFMMYNDSVIADEDGSFSDWLEIYNPGLTSINLLNWSLTDDATNTTKWFFPDTIIASGQYVLVFASGKNRSIKGKQLHTNFKISSGDKFLALIEPDGITLSHYYNNIPEQYSNISYGIFNSVNTYFDVSSPGFSNSNSNFIPPAQFSVKRGFYSQAFNLQLGTSVAGATIRYTKDGSYPSETNGILYSTPITISTTTPVQAVVYLNGKKSYTATNTYIFLNDVRIQNNTPVGYPAEWGPYTILPGNAIADYEMDPEIVNNSLYSDSLDKAFKSIPTVSIVTSIGNLFSSLNDSDKGGIYYYTGAPETEKSVPAPVGDTKVTTYGIGHGWGRQASVEYFDPNSTDEFSINCRLELHGGHSRRAEKNPKHSFNIEFKKDYGPSKLKFNIFHSKSAVDVFDALVIRGGFGNSWLHGDYNQRKRGMYIHDSWLKQTQLDMGEKGAHTKFVNLYLNGIYWGLYCISEKLDENFAASYFKGRSNDFDVVKDYGEATSGTIDSWNQMIVSANNGMTSNIDYFKLLGKNSDGTDNPAYPAYVSVDNLIDFMLANIYGGNNDWDHHNWTAIRNRMDPGNGFKFLAWDGERIFEGINDDVVTTKNNLNRPSGLFNDLMENAEFRLEVADHIQSHFFNNGALTPEKVTERWLKFANQINLAIICESARWGDYRRDVHPYGGSNYQLCTKATYWDVEEARLINNYFPYRTGIVFNQLKNLGLYPAIAAPQFSWYGKNFYGDTTITISGSGEKIYYTTDGTDPRLVGGNISPNAKIYSSAILLTDSVTLKARIKTGSDWSALVKADYNKLNSNNTSNSKVFLAENGNVKIFPNPVINKAYFIFELTKTEMVELKIYNLSGKLVEIAYSGNRTAGKNTIVWLPSVGKTGMYYYQLKCGSTLKSGKLMLIQ